MTRRYGSLPPHPAAPGRSTFLVDLQAAQRQYRREKRAVIGGLGVLLLLGLGAGMMAMGWPQGDPRQVASLEPLSGGAAAAGTNQREQEFVAEPRPEPPTQPRDPGAKARAMLAAPRSSPPAAQDQVERASPRLNEGAHTAVASAPNATTEAHDPVAPAPVELSSDVSRPLDPPEAVAAIPSTETLPPTPEASLPEPTVAAEPPPEAASTSLPPPIAADLSNDETPAPGASGASSAAPSTDSTPVSGSAVEALPRETPEALEPAARSFSAAPIIVGPAEPEREVSQAPAAEAPEPSPPPEAARAGLPALPPELAFLRRLEGVEGWDYGVHLERFAGTGMQFAFTVAQPPDVLRVPMVTYDQWRRLIDELSQEGHLSAAERERAGRFSAYQQFALALPRSQTEGYYVAPGIRFERFPADGVSPSRSAAASPP
jgi:hypothetical protein